jgi:hypothetical protein
VLTTGKVRCSPSSPSLRIEGDGANRCPVAGPPTPALWIARARCLVDRVAGSQHPVILSGVALCRGDVANAAMPVVVVVPMDKTNSPPPGRFRSTKPLSGNSGRYLAVRNNASTKALSSLTRGR